MTTNASFIFTDSDSLSLSIDNTPYNVDASNSNWDKIIEALKAGDFDAIPGLINRAKAIEGYVSTEYRNIEVNAEYGTITYAGTAIHSTLVDHIFRMKDEGFPITPMVMFLDNLMDNPSKRAVDELYGFLQYGKLPLTEDGCFIAYKRVRDDYKSVHDGKTDNSIGVTVSMPRNMVNENSQETCSTGLHFCSFEYLKSFAGARIVVLKVNPRDVVSIPADYNNTKGRACRYDVVGELSQAEFNEALNRNIFTEAVRSETGAKVEPKATTFAGTGPKVGPVDSPFYQGYVKGYNTGLASVRNYDSSNNYFGDRDDAYTEGYDKGFCDAEEGVDRRYITPAEQLRLTADKEFEAIDKKWDPSKAAAKSIANRGPVASKDFVLGYQQGYKSGRNRTVLMLSAANSEYNRGADIGYKDGKGHKRKQY